VERALRREDERQEQDRAKLADRARRKDVGAEARVELARVGEDRDQGADRGRGERRAGVERRDHEPRCREDRRGAVRDHERERPPVSREPQRRAADPPQVDLVAGEEEEHPEAEVGEELREVIDMPDPQHVRADDDPKHELEDDRRHDEPASRPDRGEGARHGCGDHDDEE
jgi:hypothetical protein